MERIKRFLEWITLKEKLHASQKEPPLVSERELWWVSLGENIGSEIDGKSDLFSRPALILKKLSHGFFLVAPTTSKMKKGSWYVRIVLEEKETFVCLHQIRAVDHRRLSDRLGQLDDDDFKRVKDGFWKLYR